MTIPKESRNQWELANNSERSLVFRYQPFVSGLRHKTRDTQNKNWAAFSLTEGVSNEVILNWKNEKVDSSANLRDGTLQRGKKTAVSTKLIELPSTGLTSSATRRLTCATSTRIVPEKVGRRRNVVPDGSAATESCTRCQGLRAPSLRSALKHTTLV